MAFAYVGNASGTAASATEIHCNVAAGAVTGNLLIAVYSFENVTAGSGPWIIPNVGGFSTNYIGPANGWLRLCYQDPVGTGMGIEVWGAVLGSGTLQYAMFNGTYSAVTVTAAYSGEYAPNGSIFDGAVRLATTGQWTGNAPASPSVFALAGELVIACGADAMTGTFGNPTGYTDRVDTARAGAGTAQATIADAAASATGNTGLIQFPNTAFTSTTQGSMATLAIRPSTVTTPNSYDIDGPLPPDLDIGDGYTLRVSAHSAVSGQPMTGVTIGTVVFTVENVGGGSVDDLSVGSFMLVPGPNA